MSMYQRPLGFVRQNMAERRRNELSRVDDMTAKDTTVSGRHLIYGLGEARFDVNFPVTFAHRPVPTIIGELDVGQEIVTGAYPRAEGVVLAYQTQGAIEGAFDGYFVGVTIGVTVFGGSDTQRLWVNWSFRGDGLRNPVHITEDVDEPI